MANSSACSSPAPCMDPACSFGPSVCAVEPGKGRRYTSKLDTDHTHRNKSPHFQSEQRWHPGTLWECTFLLLAKSDPLLQTWREATSCYKPSVCSVQVLPRSPALPRPQRSKLVCFPQATALWQRGPKSHLSLLLPR